MDYSAIESYQLKMEKLTITPFISLPMEERSPQYVLVAVEVDYLIPITDSLLIA